MKLDAKIPSGAIHEKWSNRKFEQKLVNPANKRKYKVIVVGSGLAGAAAAASMGELGYQVECFCFQDSPRRAHSIAAQGGINAAKNYRNVGDSVHRLFYDTVKGGDFRSREATVHRLAEVSVQIIDDLVVAGRLGEQHRQRAAARIAEELVGAQLGDDVRGHGPLPAKEGQDRPARLGGEIRHEGPEIDGTHQIPPARPLQAPRRSAPVMGGQAPEGKHWRPGASTRCSARWSRRGCSCRVRRQASRRSRSPTRR
jgi:hypothetical protein